MLVYLDSWSARRKPRQPGLPAPSCSARCRAVLRRYVAINHFTETVMRSNERGEIGRFPPRWASGAAVKTPPDLFAEPWRFDLFATLRKLEREHPDKPRIGDNAGSPTNSSRCPRSPFSNFPPRRWRARSASRPAGSAHGALSRHVRPAGRLPLSTTAEAYDWLRDNDDAFTRFVDVFQRRLLSHFFRAWADALPIAQHDRPDEDRPPAPMSAPCSASARRPFATATRSPISPSSNMRGCSPPGQERSRLRVPRRPVRDGVEIDEFVGSGSTRKGRSPRLGQANARLGGDAMLGASVFSVGDRFRVRLYARDLAHYELFLPGSDFARSSPTPCALSRPRFRLGSRTRDSLRRLPARLGQGARLGYTSWMSPNWADAARTTARTRDFI